MFLNMSAVKRFQIIVVSSRVIPFVVASYFIHIFKLTCSMALLFRDEFTLAGQLQFNQFLKLFCAL